jgi:predicted MFS family arabinose efflux permease
LPVVVIAILASASLALTGMIPGSIFGAAPKLAPTSAMLAIAIGLINQTSNIGNLIGPAALGAFVQAFGWTYAPAVFVGVMIAGVTVALLLRRVLRRKAPA